MASQIIYDIPVFNYGKYMAKYRTDTADIKTQQKENNPYNI